MKYKKKSFQQLATLFMSILDKGIAEICKKFNSHDGLMRADQDGAKKF